MKIGFGLVSRTERRSLLLALACCLLAARGATAGEIPRPQWEVSPYPQRPYKNTVGEAPHTEWDVSLFTGMAFTQNNDVRVQKQGGTDLTFHNVSYEGKDFESPPYYGGRLLVFPARATHWGFGAEFFHAKLYANTGDRLRVTGRYQGARVDNVEQMSDIVQVFSISHGLNLVLANVVYRWFPGKPGEGLLGRFQPYTGLGLGVAIPHVEAKVDGVFHQDYQFHGPAVEAFAGLKFQLIQHLSLFFEYKFTYAALGSMTIPHGSIEMDPLTHHLVAGITVGF